MTRQKPLPLAPVLPELLSLATYWASVTVPGLASDAPPSAKGEPLTSSGKKPFDVMAFSISDR